MYSDENTSVPVLDEFTEHMLVCYVKKIIPIYIEVSVAAGTQIDQHEYLRKKK